MFKIDNGWSLSPKVFEWIHTNLELGSTIVELGSGEGSFLLSRKYEVYSVEHDPSFVGLYPTVNYVYAPIVDGWYSLSALADNLPFEYDLLIIDGPPGNIGRKGILKNFSSLFRWDKPIIVDDVNRSDDMEIYDSLLSMSQKVGTIIDDNEKSFGVIL